MLIHPVVKLTGRDRIAQNWHLYLMSVPRSALKFHCVKVDVSPGMLTSCRTWCRCDLLAKGVRLLQ